MQAELLEELCQTICEGAGRRQGLGGNRHGSRLLVFDHHTVLVGDEEDDAPLFDNGEGVRKTGAAPQGAHGLAALRGGKLLHKGRGAAEMLIGRSENQYAPLGRHRG